MLTKIINILMPYLPIKFLRYHYYRIDLFVKSIPQKFDIKGKKLIDIGSESGPFKAYLKESQYFSQDIVQNKNNSINFIGDICAGIPTIPSNNFDYILCTQVVEHLYDPKKAYEEFFRILKPKGVLFVTTHMVFDEHMEPYDYFRFTKFGLASLGEKAGFTVESIVPQGGVFHVLSYIISFLPIKLFTKRDSKLYYAYLIVFFLPILLMNILCYYLDFLDHDKTLTLNYECIYRKN